MSQKSQIRSNVIQYIHLSATLSRSNPSSPFLAVALAPFPSQGHSFPPPSPSPLVWVHSHPKHLLDLNLESCFNVCVSRRDGGPFEETSDMLLAGTAESFPGRNKSRNLVPKHRHPWPEQSSPSRFPGGSIAGLPGHAHRQRSRRRSWLVLSV